MVKNSGLFDNALVLGGGGAKRVAYSGAVDVLELNHFELVVGTSVGAVIAMLIALGVRKDHIQYFCEHDMADVLSPHTVEYYQDNGPVEALLNMAGDESQMHCNRSLVLRELLQYEISSRMHQIYLFLFEFEALDGEHQWNHINIIDQTRWLSYQTNERLQQQLKDRLTQWIRKPQQLNFIDLAWLRTIMVQIGLSAQLKRLIVTTTEINATQAAAPLSSSFFGDGEQSNISLIDAVMASCAFVGIEALVTVGKNPKRHFIDGGVLHQCPTFLALKHLNKTEHAKVVSLNLEADEHANNLIMGLVDDSLLQLVNKALKTQLANELDSHAWQQARDEQHQWLRSTQAQRLIEINLKPIGIDTLTMVMHPAIKQLAVQQAKIKIQARLAAMAYLLIPDDWLH